jgi:Xaa-Pro dipeptidase
MKLTEIQRELQRQKLDGWLFFDHHQRDPLAYRVLGFHPRRQVTRRWYYYIPASGEPRGLVHRVEPTMLDQLPGRKFPYASWTEQRQRLGELLSGSRRIAMQYSPDCAIPYIAMVDAGTVELVRSLGVEVVSSADLIQVFEARWNPNALESHLEAGRRVDRIRAEAFAFIGTRTRSGLTTSELEVRNFILDSFATAGLFTDHGPIVAVNENSANPHYEPSEQQSSDIRAGDFVLIDMWAKLAEPGSVYYDITWTGFCGPTPPTEMRMIFDVVRGARDAAIRRVKEAVTTRQPLHGYEVDDAARGFIQERGHAQFFTHRTGHSIGQEVHGNGANMDNLETHDERLVVPWTCFSIEPGIYLSGFGVRSEVNVFVGDDTAQVTGEMQSELVTI